MEDLMTEKNVCEDCGVQAETRECDDCGHTAAVIDCGHYPQPAEISGSAYDGRPVCHDCARLEDFEDALKESAWYVVMPDGRVEWLSQDVRNVHPRDVMEHLLGDANALPGDLQHFMDQVSVWLYFDQDHPEWTYLGEDDKGLGVAVPGYSAPPDSQQGTRRGAEPRGEE